VRWRRRSFRAMPTHPDLGADERPAVRFRFEGREVVAREGQSVGAALLADGVDILTRSFKFHRPRGYTCGAGACGNCLLTVDGLPSVPSCVTPVAPGLEVRRERGWPSVDVDVLAGADLVSRWFPAGFQFRYFRQHPRAGHAFERVLGLLAGGGKHLPPAASAPVLPIARRTCSVVVVGAGPSGLAAALAASDAGADVVLVEEQERLGGRLRAETATVSALGLTAPGPRLAEVLTERVARDPGITLLRGSALGWYEDGVLPVAGRDALHELVPHVVVEATGSYEAPALFAGNDRPGVLLAGAISRLFHVERVRPGRRYVVVACDDRGIEHAIELHHLGVEVVAVVDQRGADEAGTERLRALAGRGIEHLAGARPVRSHGRRRVRGLTVRTGDGRRLRLRCDTVSVAGPLRPSEGLSLQRRYQGENRLSAETPGQDLSARAPVLLRVGGSAGRTRVQDAVDDGFDAGRTAATAVGNVAPFRPA
jgi:sarcosine oxidase subunit alpha